MYLLIISLARGDTSSDVWALQWAQIKGATDVQDNIIVILKVRFTFVPCLSFLPEPFDAWGITCCFHLGLNHLICFTLTPHSCG